MTVGVLRLRRRPVARVRHEELLHPARFVRPAADVARRLGTEIEDGEEDLSLLDALPATAEAEEVAAAALGHALDPIPEIGRPAVGEPERGLVAARIDAPDVVPVRHEQRGVFLDPHGPTVRRRPLRVIVEFVVECYRQVPGEAAGGRGSVRRRGLPIAIRLVPPVGVRAVRRCAGTAEAAHGLHDQPPLPGHDIDGVGVFVAAVPRHRLAVRQVARGEEVVAHAGLGARHVGDVRGAELHDGVPALVDHGQVRAVALAVRLHELHRLQVRIAPVPDVQRHAVVVERLLVGFRLRARRGAEEDAPAIVADRNVAVLAHPPAVRHTARHVIRQPLQRPVGEAVEREGGLVQLPLVAVAQERQALARLVEGELLVVPLAGEHLHAFAASRIREVDAVSPLVLGRRHEGDARPRLRHLVVHDVRVGVLGTRVQVQEDERRAIVLLVPLLVLRRALLLFLFLALFLSLLLGFLLLGLGLLLFIGVRSLLFGVLGEEIGDEGAAVFGNLERLDGAGAPHADVVAFAREGLGQRDHGERVSGEIVAPRALPAKRIHDRLHRRHAEGKVTRISREGGAAAAEAAVRPSRPRA